MRATIGIDDCGGEEKQKKGERKEIEKGKKRLTGE